MISSKVFAEAIFEMVQKDGSDPKQISDRFVRFLENNNLMSQLPRVLYYLELKEELQRREKALLLTTVTSPAEETMEKIKNYIGVDSTVSVLPSKDEEVIGGFVASYRGKRYDASFANQLRHMQISLMEGE